MTSKQSTKYKKKPLVEESLRLIQSMPDKDWDKLLLKSVKNPHFMQSNAWAMSRKNSSWQVSRTFLETNKEGYPLQLFSRLVPGLGKLYYAPEISGININNLPKFTEIIQQKFSNGLAIKVELYQPYDEKLIDTFIQNGWVKANSVQHRSTVIVDLSGSEEELFARIKSRARYEVRTAQKNNVKVEKVEINKLNLDLLFDLINITAKRTGAFFRKKDYFDNYWNSFNEAGQGSLYFAWYNKEMIAGAYVIDFGEFAWYKDGGSVRSKSKLMGSRLLQWEIMRDLQKRGIKSYDLSGIPAEKDKLTSSMKGLYTFKTGFSNETSSFMPAMELPTAKRYLIWPKAEQQFLRAYSVLTNDFWY